MKVAKLELGEPTHICKVCGAAWRLNHPDIDGAMSVSVIGECAPCCDCKAFSDYAVPVDGWIGAHAAVRAKSSDAQKHADTLQALIKNQGSMIVELEARIKRAVDQRDTP